MGLGGLDLGLVPFVSFPISVMWLSHEATALSMLARPGLE